MALEVYSRPSQLPRAPARVSSMPDPLLRDLGRLKRDGEGRYAERQRLLHQSRGRFSTVDAYAVGDVPLGSFKKYVDHPDHWILERRALHEEILRKHLSATRELAFQTAARNAIYALRGNTAAGKSTIIRKAAILQGGPFANKAGIVNPDLYKIPLLDAERGPEGTAVTHAQVHEESSMIARRLLREAEEIEGGSMVIDKRFYESDDIDELLRLAARTGKGLHLIDIEAPLEISLLRILTRPRAGEDPRVPFAAVAEAFAGIRRHRERLVRLAESDPRIASYALYVVNGRGDSELTAQLVSVEGARRVESETSASARIFFESLLQNTEEEIARLRQQIITEAVIQQAVPGFYEPQRDKIRQALIRHRGRTLSQAVDWQAHELPLEV